MPTDPGQLGVWTATDYWSAPEVARFAQQLETWGYGALWIPEAVGRDPFCLLGYLAGRTERLVLATGIANIYARDAMTLRAIHRTMSGLAPGRFILGLGVSHAHLVSKQRGHSYEKPIPAMRRCLDAMEQALYLGAEPEEEAPIVLAALRDRMLQLAARRTRGAHPYFTPVEHTAHAREVLGPDAWLCPELMAVAERDPVNARAVARKHMAIYLRLPNYQNNLRQFGFADEDFADGGSDRLIDAITVWGDDDAIRARIDAHHRAGADHVCIQPFRPDGAPHPDTALLERLAPAR